MTVGEAVADAARQLAAAGIESARREARLLVALADGADEAVILGYPERALDPAAGARLQCLLARRVKREPLSRIRGTREFWSLVFALSADTLDPRPDSETLVAAALASVPDRAAPLRLLDLGTGTGCLLLAVLSELPNAIGVGVDIAPGAAATARRNAASMGLANRAFFVVGGWGAAFGGGFDLVLANPPYVPSAALAGLAPEVQFDPRTALDGGGDGLAAYRALAPDLARLLAPRGIAFIEVGAGQSSDVASLFVRGGLVECARKADLAGTERCLALARPKKIVGNVTLPV
jgi:release factor glutamine methyltransferase